MSHEPESVYSSARPWFWRRAAAAFIAGSFVIIRCGGSVASPGGNSGGTGGTSDSGTSTGGSKPSVCTAGSARSCLCANGLNGVQQCLSDGSGYGTCSGCTVGTGGAGGSGGSSGTGGANGGAAGAPVGDGGCGIYGNCVGGSTPACEQCTCDNCACESDQCTSSAGCFAIARCVGLTLCSGADCYQPDTCQRAIDGAGAEGQSLWQALQSCRSKAGCVCDLQSAGISCWCENQTTLRCSDGSANNCNPYMCDVARGTCFAYCETNEQCIAGAICAGGTTCMFEP